MKSTRALITWLVATAAAMFGFVASAHAQGITTAAMNGLVTDASGSPVAKATVTVVHNPSGTKITTITRSNGRYDLPSLRVGGPYTVTVTTAANETETRDNIYLDLGDNTDVSFGIGSNDVVHMERYDVSTSRDVVFDVGRMGSSNSFNSRDIQNAPTPRNNVQDIARLDPRITLNSLDQGGQMSAQGQNFRFNSFLIDGVEAIDPYGLNSNGFGSLRGPVSLDSVQSLTVEFNPVDVRRSGFTGALINVVTKSGSNEFQGSAGYQFKGNSLPVFGKDVRMRGIIPDGKEQMLDSRTWSFTLSGPIIPNKLFFSVAYEDYYQRSSAPTPGLNLNGTMKSLDGSMKPTMDVINEILKVAKDKYGYDAGTVSSTGANTAKQKTYAAKIDWNITNDHRAVFSYNRTDGTTPSFSGYTSTTGISASNYWFDRPQVRNAYTAQVFSQWTNDLRTEASISYNTYDATPKNRGNPFPSVGIGSMGATRTTDGAKITNGYFNFGTEYSRQMNQLETSQWLGKFNAQYSIGKHVIIAGIEYDATEYSNKYAQNVFGNYTFSDVIKFNEAKPYSYSSTKVAAGYDLEDLYAQWTYTDYIFYAQDTWKPTSRLTVSGGIRLDYPHADKAPKFNQDFYTAFGIRNDTTINGNYLISPRLGFNYVLNSEQKTQVRGSIGLYQARSPGVWLSNAYQNAGAGASISQSVSSSSDLGAIFTQDVNNQPTPAGTLPSPTINVTDPNFMMPSLWKGNLAIEHKLPWGGLILTAELGASKINKALYVTFLNYKVASGNGTMPDGRIRYAGNITPGYTDATLGFNSTTSTAGRRNNTKFADVYKLGNTNKGQSTDITLSLNRPIKNNWGAGIAWSRNNATEVSPLTSSTAGSLYNTRAVYNPNEDVASTSNTNTKHKVVAHASYRHEWKRGWGTTATLTYEGLTGRPYSWIFKGDANGDGFAYNDLFYVPTGPNDPKVRWYDTTGAEAAEFFKFVEKTSLKDYKGKVVPRNSETSPWTQTFHLSITQEIPIYKKVRTEIYCNLINFANLLNNKWGVKYEVPFSYKRSVAGAGYDAAGNGGKGQYLYTFRQGNTLDPVPVAYDEVSSSDSIWELVIGCRVKF